MRILALDYEPSSRRGGQELSLVDECVGLAGRGHQVTLGHVRDGDLLARYVAAGVTPLALEDIEVRPGRRLGSAADVARSAVRAAASRPDVVCVNQYHDTLFGAAVSQLAGAPLVCHLRVLAPGSLCAQWRFGLPNVTRFIAASQAIADAWLAQRGISPSVMDVAHDGIDMRRFSPRPGRGALRASLGVPDDAFLVVCVGRLDPSKNLEGLLDSFAILRLSVPHAHLAIAGQPVNHRSEDAGRAYVAALQDHAAALRLGPSVHWLGSRRDVPELLSAADASALFAYEEALGRATFESLACGTPVIASRNGGTAEILTGEFEHFRFDPNDHEEAAAKLLSLVGWRDRDPTLGERARLHAVQRFSIDAKVSGVESSFGRALASRRRRNGPRGRWLRAVYPEPELRGNAG
jgi:glycosyltransferase involved in cell wall biosynthesis